MIARPLCLAAMTAAWAAVQAPQDPPPTFRATASIVTVDVTALQRNGRVATGLEKHEFEVLDNGVRQDILELSYGKLPIDVTVALDVSYSVDGPMLARLRRAVGQLMRDLGKDDRLKLIFFSNRVARIVDFTTDVDAVERAITGAKAGGGTNLLDTISVSLVSASHPDRRQLVVLFTDGLDSGSTTSREMLLDVAQRTTARLAVVVPGESLSGAAMMNPAARAAFQARARHVGTLGPVTAETGGVLMQIAGSMDLTATFRRILEEFRSTYVLYFRPIGVERAGFHTLDVTVGREGVTVKARRGYFGG